jgi:hypothetical protein
MKSKILFPIITLSFISLLFVSIPNTSVAITITPNPDGKTIMIDSSELKGKELAFTTHKSIARLRERVIVYLAFRTDQPQVYRIPGIEQRHAYKFVLPPGLDKNRSTTFKFIYPPNIPKNRDTTYLYPYIPEWNEDWEQKLQHFEKGLRRELESQIQSIRFKEDDDNFAYVVLRSQNQYKIIEVQLWAFMNNDWYPYRENHFKMQN